MSDWTQSIPAKYTGSVPRSQQRLQGRLKRAADGKTAITIFTKIYSTAKSCILLAELLTGRTHQIRVHSAFCHTPLIGDTFYNGAPADDLHLISYQLQMVHPFSKDELSITVPNELLPAWLNVEQLNEYKLNKS